MGKIITVWKKQDIEKSKIIIISNQASLNFFILGESVRADERHPNGLQDRRSAGIFPRNERTSDLPNAINCHLLVHIRVLQVHAGDSHHLGNRWRNNLRDAWPESSEAEGAVGRGTGALAKRAAGDLRSRHVRHPQLYHSAYAKRENLRCHSQLDGHLVKLDWLYTICFVNSFVYTVSLSQSFCCIKF